MNRRKITLSASISVVLATLFVAAGFIGINQRLAFATSSNSDEEEKCMDAAK